MDIAHETTVWFSKSFGLFYLIALSIGVLVYAYWPSNKKRFDACCQVHPPRRGQAMASRRARSSYRLPDHRS